MSDTTASLPAGVMPGRGAPQAGRPGAATPARPQTRSDYIGFFALVFGMFMAILDIQIVASSISEIQAGLAASPEETSWIQTSYLIAEVIMIPLSGWLSRLLSTRYLFVISCLGFTAMSAACALAWNIESMIVFRALQGFLGGAMIPTVFATVFIIFPPMQRAKNSVFIGLIATLAPTIGPTLGGYLTDYFSWHWLFLVNIVPGTIVTILVWTFADFDKPNLKLLKGFDFFGILFVAVFLGSLQYVLEEGPLKNWFDDQTIVLVSICSAVGAVLFFARELTFATPVIDLHGFRDRNFSLGCLFAFVLGMGLYGAVYIAPLFLARIAGYSPIQIGETMMFVGLAQIVSSPLAGFLARKIDLRLELALGFGLFAFALYLNAQLTAQARFDEFLLPQLLRGLSLMLCFVPINQITLGKLPPELVKNASGIYNLMRNLGGAIGLALINTVLTERLALHTLQLRERLTVARSAVQPWIDATTAKYDQFNLAGSSDVTALHSLSNLVTREASVLTFNDALFMMAAFFSCALLLLPLCRRVAPPGAPRPDGGH